jgi:hypothetical protein
MKKLLLLLSIPLMAFKCEPETLDCPCVKVNYVDNGTELVMTGDTPAQLSDCNGNETNPVVHVKGTPYWYAYEIKCD